MAEHIQHQLNAGNARIVEAPAANSISPRFKTRVRPAVARASRSSLLNTAHAALSLTGQAAQVWFIEPFV